MRLMPRLEAAHAAQPKARHSPVDAACAIASIASGSLEYVADAEASAVADAEAASDMFAGAAARRGLAR